MEEAAEVSDRGTVSEEATLGILRQLLERFPVTFEVQVRFWSRKPPREMLDAEHDENLTWAYATPVMAYRRRLDKDGLWEIGLRRSCTRCMIDSLIHEYAHLRLSSKGWPSTTHGRRFYQERGEIESEVYQWG